MKTLFLIGALLLVPATLLAQGGAREPHVAIVRAADGGLVAGAEVTFVATDGTGRAQDDDVVRARSNQQGRARVDLLGGRDYLAFAALAVEGGAYLSQGVPRAATTTELELEGGTPRPAAWRLQGLQAWREKGPIEVELEPFGCAALAQRVPVGEDGTFRVTPVVSHYLQARVFAAGRVVHADQVFSRDSVTLPPPREVSCLVVDDAGKPVAGVELVRIANGWHRHEGAFPGGPTARRWHVGTTDAEGRATLLLALAKDPFEGVDDFPGVVFAASKDGFAETWSGFTSVPFCDRKSVVAKDLEGTLRFSLKAAPTAKVAVQSRGEAPGYLLARVENTVPDGNSANNCARDLIGYAVDAEGHFAMRSFAEGGEVKAVIVPGTRPPLEDGDPFARLAHPRAMVVPPTVLDAAGGVDLRSLQALRLQLIDAGGGPARGAALVCSPLCGDHYVPAEDAMRATADAAGRVVLPVLPGKWLLFALLDGAFARLELDVAAGLPVQTLKLELLPSSTVHITDGTDPVVGARLDGTGGSWSSCEDPAESFVTDMAHHVNDWLLSKVRTDEQGNATIRILTAERVETRFCARLGNKKSVEHKLAEGEHFEFVLR
ncbi:MAG: hypothetical protein H6838_07125 [Planctomycetes bacterium]|nr:hypothetical protein [Planctomycetota bacterium]